LIKTVIWGELMVYCGWGGENYSLSRVSRVKGGRQSIRVGRISYSTPSKSNKTHSLPSEKMQ